MILYNTTRTFIEAGTTEDWGWNETPHVLDTRTAVATVHAAGPGAGSATAKTYPAMHFIMTHDDAGWLLSDLKPGVFEIDPQKLDTSFLPIKSVDH